MIIVVLVILGAILIWPPMQEVVRMGSRENLAVLHIMRESIMTDLLVCRDNMTDQIVHHCIRVEQQHMLILLSQN